MQVHIAQRRGCQDSRTRGAEAPRTSPARGTLESTPSQAPAPQEAPLLQSLARRIPLVRIGFGAFWTVDAWYKWQPAFLGGFARFFTRQATNTPAMLKPWFQFWSRLLTPHPLPFAVATALAETAIALCLVLGLARRWVYLLGAVFSFLIWAVPESFGRFWTSGQTDLGTSIMYVFIFLALYLVDILGDRSAWTLDTWLQEHVSWWRRIA